MKKVLLAVLILLCFSVKHSTAVTYPKHFPDFSWDKISVYAHVGSQDDFTQEQYAILTQFPVVCINGSTGKREFNGSDNGVRIVSAKLKELNSNMKVLCYLSFNTDYSSRYSTGRVITETQNAHWALKDKDDKAVTTSGTTPRMDKSLPEVRDYIYSIIDNWSSMPNIDGIFIDSYTSFSKDKKARFVKKMGEQKAKVFLDGEDELRGRIKNNISSNRITIGNGVSTKADATEEELAWLETVSGGMMDHFAFLGGDTPDNIAASIERISQLGKQGNMLMIKCWPEINHKSPNYKTTSDEEKLKIAKETIVFPLACYLCGAEKYSYFCYSWAWGVDAGGVYIYDEYNKPLGEPLGDYKRDGYVFTRKFKYVDVWVNVKTREAKLNWKR